MMSKIRKLLTISRPVSWPNTAYPFAAGYLMTGGGIDATFVIGTLFFLIPYNLLMYGINDVFDYESDIRNPRKGGIEGAREQKAFHPTIVWAAIASSVPFALYLFATGSALSAGILGALLFFVLAYSIKGLRFKEIPILDSITSSTHFVGPLIFALALTGFSGSYLPYIIAFFMWGMASHAFGAVQDIVPDKEGGIASIATVFGARRTILIVCALYLLSSILVMTQGPTSAIVGAAGLIYFFNALQYVRLTDIDSFRANKGWRRFIWLNMFVGFVVTMVLLYSIYT